MSQAAWHRTARGFLPEILPEDRSADSLHDLSRDLFELLKHGDPESDLVDRIWEFFDYCLKPRRAPSVRVDAAEGFMRHCASDADLRPMLVERMSDHAQILSELLEPRMPSSEWGDFVDFASRDSAWESATRNPA